MRLPQPPLDNSATALHKATTDIVNFLGAMYQNGSKHKGFTQDQINNMTETTQLGTTVFNTTTNESNVSYLDNGTVKWRSI